MARLDDSGPDASIDKPVSTADEPPAPVTTPPAPPIAEPGGPASGRTAVPSPEPSHARTAREVFEDHLREGKHGSVCQTTSGTPPLAT
jgi:hypothetical protein